MTTPHNPGFPPPPSDFQSDPAAATKRKKWPWIVGAIVLVFVLAAAFGGGENGDSETTADSTTTDSGALVAPAPASQKTVAPLVAAAPSGKGKTIVYEVISDSSSLNSVSYFDENSELQQESALSAPWSLTVDNSSTVAIAGVTAQTEGLSVTCRVTVDGEVKDEQTSTGKYAVVNCTAPLF